MKTFLLEIGTEEIPARFIAPAKEGLQGILRNTFNAYRISFGGIKIQATPRRMAVFVEDVAEVQSEGATIKYGPPANRAFDASGAPTKAATGFAKSQGVNVEELKKIIKDGVEIMAVEKIEIGRPTKEVLPEILGDIITGIPYQKRMRWGTETFEFARPIQWILALFGHDTIEFTLADVKSSNFTYGHRFLSKGKIVIAGPAEYMEKLKANSIILNEDERMETILQGIKRIEGEAGGYAIGDNDLIKEIMYITEYPYPLMGGFDTKFLSIPKEVLINVMKSHQRYIPILSKEGGLMPHFIFFANTAPVEDRGVVRGNEKVLRARLADAQFFYEEDKKTPLSDLYERLASIVFHVKLGTLKDKTDRVATLSHYLASILGFDDRQKVGRAAKMIKADLLTHMVGEFPELQGVMGRIYALNQGEDNETAYAIEEHYLPSGGNGDLPKTALGVILGIADKIDSLTSFFSAGITPTGNLDPYALRRQSLGIIRTAIDKKLHIPLEEMIDKAYEGGNAFKKRLSLEETKAPLIDFIATRFKFSMMEDDHNQEFIECVLPHAGKDIYDGYLRLLALENQNSVEDFKKLMIAFKRAFNITKSITEDLSVNPSLFNCTEEHDLFNMYEQHKDPLASLMIKKDYSGTINVLVGFKETIDNYFDRVFVMDKDETIKNNRLALLKKIKDMFLRFGDFSKIRTEQGEK